MLHTKGQLRLTFFRVGSCNLFSKSWLTLRPAPEGARPYNPAAPSTVLQLFQMIVS